MIIIHYSTSNDPPIKTENSSESSNSNDLVGSEDVTYMNRETPQALHETNGTIINTDIPPTYRPSALKHEYAEIIINDDMFDNNEPEGSGAHRVRFACDEERTLNNGCTHHGKETHTKPEDYTINGNYITNHCRKHGNGMEENGTLEVSNAIVDNRKQNRLVRINEDAETEVMETHLTENNHDLDIVKLDVVMPTKEAQYASIVAIHPHEHDLILKRNKTPFLKTFAPVSGHNEQNGRNFDENDCVMYKTVDNTGKNTTTRPHEAIYAVVDKSKKINKVNGCMHVKTKLEFLKLYFVERSQKCQKKYIIT
jgi:hypothetical protein